MRFRGFANAFAGRRVFLTGHTGFKGAWLAEWLLGLGAEVRGYSLAPSTTPALFEQLTLESRLQHQIGDVRNAEELRAAVEATRPDFVFHLAAQPLVRLSYAEPVQTFATNVMGTINVLESVRLLDRPCVVIVVTTDKCYLNREWLYGYRESDALGGHDPYSASKAAAEIATASWRSSFLQNGSVKVATARAGNVVGGGDWASDRIVPDSIRALRAGQPIPVRNRLATRPWQHVLEPLSGYLWLAALLAESDGPNHGAESLESAFNFGPQSDGNRNVGALVDRLLSHWPGQWIDASDGAAPHEARFLQLAIDKATRLLGWRPTWSFDRTIAETVGWYRAVEDGGGANGQTVDQIMAYTRDAAAAGLPWASDMQQNRAQRD